MDVSQPSHISARSGSRKLFAVFTLAGGAIICLGTFLPWASLLLPEGVFYTRTGFGGRMMDGVFFLGFGAIIAAVGVARLYGRPWRLLQRLPILVGLIVGMWAWSDIESLWMRLIPQYPGSFLGPGLYVIVVGAVAAVIGGFAVDRPQVTS